MTRPRSPITPTTFTRTYIDFHYNEWRRSTYFRIDNPTHCAHPCRRPLPHPLSYPLAHPLPPPILRSVSPTHFEGLVASTHYHVSESLVTDSDHVEVVYRPESPTRGRARLSTAEPCPTPTERGGAQRTKAPLSAPGNGEQGLPCRRTILQIPPPTETSHPAVSAGGRRYGHQCKRAMLSNPARAATMPPQQEIDEQHHLSY